MATFHIGNPSTAVPVATQDPVRFNPDSLLELGRTLVPTATAPLRLDQTIETILALFGAEYCEIVEQVDTGEIVRRAAAGPRHEGVGSGHLGFDSWVRVAVERNQATTVRDVATQSQQGGGSAPYSGCWVPIPGATRPYGALGILKTAPHHFSTAEACLLQSLANNLGSALELQKLLDVRLTIQRRFHTNFALTALGMVLLDQDSRISSVNAAFRQLMGYTEDKLIDAYLHDFAIADDLDTFREHLRDLLAGNIRNYAAELRLTTQDQRVIWVRLNASPVREEAKRTNYAIVIMQEITDWKNAQLRLEEQTAYLKGLFEASPIAIVALDPEHRIQMCNPAFERLFQYTQSEMVNTRLDEMIAGPEEASEAAELTRLVVAGETTYIQTRRHRKDGSLVDVEIFGVPLMAGGKQIGVYGLYHDISERKRAERSLEHLTGRLLRLQDEERRRIARELHDTTGQSLAAISIYLNVVKEVSDNLAPAAQKALLESIDLADQCSREIRTVSYLLHPPLLEDIGLGATLRWYIAGFSQRSGIEVDVNIPEHLERFSPEIELTLFRIVQEGLTNVHRHSASARAGIRLKATTKKVALEIRDSGRGIPVEVLKAQSSGAQMLGVGIVGMQERAEQLGGRVDISSSSRGTLIRVVLPRGAKL